MCASEHEFCTFSGTALVRYGLDGSYAYDTYTDGVSCSNAVFGDPLIGATKQCWYSYSDDPERSDAGPEPPEPDSGESVDPSEVDYSGPITITSGGTYSGAWESTDPDTPAITIATSEPVVIENSFTRSVGHHIRAGSGRNAHVTVRNVHAVGVRPQISGRYPGRFVLLDTYRYLLVEHSYLEQTSGIYLHQSVDGATVKVLRNRARNIDGRRSDGQGGFSGVHLVQFVQFDKGNNMVDTEVAWNEVINEPFNSFVEDIISIYQTSGRSNDPIRIHNNYFQGAYPTNPATDGYSGGGIMLGDGRNANRYLHAFDNQVVSTSNYGIAISAGAHNRMYDNRIVSCGYVTDPNGNEVFVASQNVGAYIWNLHKSSDFSDNSGSNNEIAWMRTPSTRNDWWVPDAASWTGNERMHATPVPCSAEQEEYDRWLAKIDNVGIRVGLLE